MNVKGVSIIVGVAVVILLVVLLPIKPGDVPPLIQDTTQVRDDSSIGIGSGNEDNIDIKDESSMGMGADEDVPTITDSVEVEKQNGTDFYYDENGTKHFVIEATDKPAL